MSSPTSESMLALLKHRKSLKGAVTRAATFADGLGQGATVTEEEICTRLELLEKAWDEYSKVSIEIIMNGNAEQAEAQERDEETVEDKYIKTRSTLKKALGEFQSMNASLHSPPPTPPHAAVNAATSADSNVKLPRIELPTFSGDYLEWREFYDLFTSMVHNNDKISGAQKLQYLKTSLKGEASDLIESFDTTDANYAEALAVLKERYHNERQIIMSHLSKLLKQPKMKEESATELKALINCTVKNYRALKVMQVPVSEWDHIMVFLVCDRLDAETRKQWELSLKDDKFPTFEELRMFLEKHRKALETSQSKRGNKPSTPNAFKVHTAKVESCAICKDDHPVYKCPKFLGMSVPSRVTITKEKALCFNCLRQRHSANACKSLSTCKKCEKRHHTLLHYDRAASGPSSTTPTTGTSAQQSSDHLVASEQSISSFVTSSHQQQGVLLKTAVVKLFDSFGQSHQCRAMFDDASEGTFITESKVYRVRRWSLTACLRSVIIGNVRNVTSRQDPLRALPQLKWILKGTGQACFEGKGKPTTCRN